MNLDSELKSKKALLISHMHRLRQENPSCFFFLKIRKQISCLLLTFESIDYSSTMFTTSDSICERLLSSFMVMSTGPATQQSTPPHLSTAHRSFEHVDLFAFRTVVPFFHLIHCFNIKLYLFIHLIILLDMVVGNKRCSISLHYYDILINCDQNRTKPKR